MNIAYSSDFFNIFPTLYTGFIAQYSLYSLIISLYEGQKYLARYSTGLLQLRLS